MSKIRNLIWPLALAFVGLAVACGGGDNGPAEEVDQEEPGAVIQAVIAQTPEERNVGLGGRASLPGDGGMLFVFDADAQHVFWMKDMLIPLDFIWISSDGHVLDLSEDVPPPAPQTPDSDLTRLQPGEPVLFVLEVNAGVVEEGGVAVGDLVTFEPDIAQVPTPSGPDEGERTVEVTIRPAE